MLPPFPHFLPVEISQPPYTPEFSSQGLGVLEGPGGKAFRGWAAMEGLNSVTDFIGWV